MIKLTLPYPPSLNHLFPTVVRGGRFMRVKSAEGQRFESEVHTLCQIARAKPYTGEVRLTLHVYRPRRTQDLSNGIKVLEDALTGYCYQDDKQVVEIHAYRHEDKKNPRVEVEVEEVTGVAIEASQNIPSPQPEPARP